MATLSSRATAVLELPWLERLLLWAIRTWSAYHDEPSAVWWSLDHAFTEAGMRPALQPFDNMMSALYSGWKRWPDIRCVRCLRLGRDECEILEVLTELNQLNDRYDKHAAQRRLARLLTRHAAQAAHVAATDLAQAIRYSGMQFASGTESALQTHSASTIPLMASLAKH